MAATHSSRRIVLVALIVLIAGVGLAALVLPTVLEGAAGDCPRRQVEGYVAKALPVMERYLAARNLAGVTSRIALSGSVRDLQEIRREYAKLTPPTCLAVAHREMLAGMDKAVLAFLGFMGKEDDKLIVAILDAADARTTWAMDTMTRVLQETR